MNKITNLGKFFIALLGVVCFSFLQFGNAANAESLSIEQKEDNSHLIKIDTQGINAEIYVDPTQVDNLFYVIDGETYIIKDNKLVKDTKNTAFGDIGVFATDTYSVTLNNGETYQQVKKVVSGTTTHFKTYGAPELRQVDIRQGGKNGHIVATYKGNTHGVTTGYTAKETAFYSFDVTNYSATKQTWECSITF